MVPVATDKRVLGMYINWLSDSSSATVIRSIVLAGQTSHCGVLLIAADSSFVSLHGGYIHAVDWNVRLKPENNILENSYLVLWSISLLRATLYTSTNVPDS